MSPPFRRKLLPTLLSLILCLLLLTSTASAASSVLGIDIGTEYIKAALVKPGIPLEIVLSKDSKRKEVSAVAFKPVRGKSADSSGLLPERAYGSDALALTGRFPGDVYQNLKPLLGLPVKGSSVVKEYAGRYPALKLVESDTGTAAFQSGSFPSDEKPFSVEELLAMELMNVKENAQALAGKAHSVKSVVFTVPAFYTAQERKALELASELAGLKVLGLVTDGLAVGINYATSRTFESINEGGKPEHHLVFDMGAGSTTATLLQMQGRTVKDVGRFNKTIQEVKVLGAGWDRTLGGDAFNTVIVKDMAKEFVASPGAKGIGKTADELLEHGRTAAKLWREAEKVRQVLSANQEKVATFEGLYDDVDFKYKIKRADFEAATTEFAERVVEPIKDALTAADMTIEDLDSIILHGGAVRTPFVQKRLEELAGASKLRTNVNADEAAVFGAAFKAARLSPSFRVKDIRDYDAGIYATWIQYSKEGKTHQQKLFPRTSVIGAVKHFEFPKLEDFTFSLFQSAPSDKGSPGEGGDMAPINLKLQTKNLTDSVNKLIKDYGCKKENITTKFSIRLDQSFGLPEVVSGSVACEVDSVKKGGVMDDMKSFLGFGKKDGDQKILQDEETSSSFSSSLSSESSASAKSESTAEPKASEPLQEKVNDKKQDKKQEKEEPKTRLETVLIQFTAEQEYAKFSSQSSIKDMKSRLNQLTTSDTARRTRDEDLNALESFIYSTRDRLSDSESFLPYISSEDRTTLDAAVLAAAEWISDEAPSAPGDAIRGKLTELKKLVSPVTKRRDEAGQRPEMTQLLRDALGQAKSLVEVIGETVKAAQKAEEEKSKSTETVTGDDVAQPSSAGDPLADLEAGDDDTASSSTTEPADTPTDVPPMLSPYTAEDLSELSATYEGVNAWLEEKLAAQEARELWEDPVFKAGELKAKANELNDGLVRLLQRKMRQAEKPKKPKGKKKAPKGKGESKSASSATEEVKTESTTIKADRATPPAAEKPVVKEREAPGPRGEGERIENGRVIWEARSEEEKIKDEL